MTLAAEETGVLGLRRGADTELDRLFRRHGDDVRRQVRVLVRNRSDVEDIVQQTFLKALAALHRGQRPHAPRQWLLAIARNECLMHYRTESRRPALVALDEALDADVPRDGARAAELQEALQQLRPAQRDALVLRELEGRGYAEIAETMGLSVSAVETLLFRARRALREQLESAGGCAEASALMDAEVLTDLQRRFVRAHVRACAACATLERRRRGKIAALKRIAGVLPLPQWLTPLFGAGGAKTVAAVALAAIAAGGAVEIVRSDSSPKPRPAPQLVHRDAVDHAAQRPAGAAAPSSPSVRGLARIHASAGGPAPTLRTKPGPGFAPAADPAIEHQRPTTTASPAGSGGTPTHARGTAPSAPATSSTSAPTTTTVLPSPTLPGVSPALTAPSATVSSVTVPSVTTPVATTPTVTTPPVTVSTTSATTVPSVTVPAATTPVATTPTVTTSTLTLP